MEPVNLNEAAMSAEQMADMYEKALLRSNAKSEGLEIHFDRLLDDHRKQEKLINALQNKVAAQGIELSRRQAIIDELNTKLLKLELEKSTPAVNPFDPEVVMLPPTLRPVR